MKARVGFLLLSAIVLAAAMLQPRNQEADLTDMASVQTLEQARTANCVVSEDGVVTSGQETWSDFYAATREGKPAAVWLASWFDRDPFESGPDMYVRELAFDGKEYTVRGGERDDIYKCLLYFPDVPSPSLSSTYETATYYILADDETLTWPEILKSWYTSPLESPVRSRAVYTEYVWRQEAANENFT